MMQGLSGFLLPDGGVCLTGDVCAERMAADEAFKTGLWPWSGPFMQGDVRVAVAWPNREIKGAESAKGCVAIGVLDPGGDLRVVAMPPFERVSTGLDAAGRMQEGLGLMLRDVCAWGVSHVVVQSDNAEDAAAWWEMVRKDPASKDARIPVDGVGEIPRALTVWREMAARIVVPRVYAVAMEQADTRGEMAPAKIALALLALSYKVSVRRRVRADEARWQPWN